MAYKVLFFVDRMRVGGIQVLLMNLQKHFDPSVVQCEYLVLDDGEDYDYENQLKKLGATVYKLKGVWLDGPHSFLRYAKAVDDFFKQHHDYVAVHMNGSSKNFIILYCAKKYGIKKRIAHSHNTGFQTNSKLKILVGNIFKYPLLKYATDYFACSKLAGKWLFGENMINQGKVHIMPNAIDLGEFEYFEEIHWQTRQELGIPKDALLVGHVGRFTKQKNHTFLLEVFQQVKKKEPRSILILAGIGELLEQSKEYARRLGIADSVKFLGFRTDVKRLTQAMDVFLMPSFYEGFPVTGIEAQASGCPCVFSDTITREAALLDETIFLSLNDNLEIWAEKVIAAAGKVNRADSKMILKEKGFDICDTVKYLERFYIS